MRHDFPQPVTEAIRQAADRLRDAGERRRACAPVRDLIGADNAQAAYAVQDLLAQERVAAGATVAGRKIGLTSPAVQRQLGVDQPDFGVLFADMECPTGDLPTDDLLQPKVEAEIAFVLAQDLIDGELDVAQVRDAVAYATAALEIVDSRIIDWDITFADTVADNGSSAKYVLGADRVTLDGFEPKETQMRMTLDGQEVSTGTGAACLGDPLAALSWLARTARDFGSPLRAGQVVLSGALGPIAAVHAGNVVSATVSGLGEVTARFGTTQEEAR
ncbi:2-keto-4-pentenoate hydratase [Flexivirga alba]|uniref:2-keto-4-pentenoate hydratase n=1 Tax=Flexivirga alba TaxID=702742 RepID=A0ABW2ABT1_9MICO